MILERISVSSALLECRPLLPSRTAGPISIITTPRLTRWTRWFRVSCKRTAPWLPRWRTRWRICPSPCRDNLRLTILRFDAIDSTNLEAIRQAKRGASEGLCIVAREQTAGRGRHERVWNSPRDAGLYLSVLLRPEFDIRIWPLITLMAAVAVANTLREACD